MLLAAPSCWTITGQQPNTLWIARYRALENLKKQTKGQFSEAQKAQLTSQLQDENRFIHEFNSKNQGEKSLDAEYGEGYGEYYSDLLDTVVKFADWSNPASLRVLLFSMYDPDSDFVKRLAVHQRTSLSDVQDLSKSHDPFARANAAGLLGHMASDAALPCNAKKQVTDLMVSLADDQDENVKHHVVRALSALGTPQAVSVLERLAASDSVSEKNEDGTVSYPVREIAQRKLQEISDSGGPKPDPCTKPPQSR